MMIPSLRLSSFEVHAKNRVITLITIRTAMSIMLSQAKATGLIAAATPVGTSTAIFAQKFGQDYERAVCMVCLSTLFSIITMPVVMNLAQMWIM